MKDLFWNPSNCECECDKSSGVGKYLDYSNCKCRKMLIGKLVEECTENIKETKLVENENENEHENNCSSSTVYIVIFSLSFAINIGIGIYFIYSRWYLKKDIPRVKFNTPTQTTISQTYKWKKLNN